MQKAGILTIRALPKRWPAWQALKGEIKGKSPARSRRGRRERPIPYYCFLSFLANKKSELSAKCLAVEINQSEYCRLCAFHACWSEISWGPALVSRAPQFPHPSPFFTPARQAIQTESRVNASWKRALTFDSVWPAFTVANTYNNLRSPWWCSNLREKWHKFHCLDLPTQVDTRSSRYCFLSLRAGVPWEWLNANYM